MTNSIERNIYFRKMSYNLTKYGKLYDYQLKVLCFNNKNVI